MGQGGCRAQLANLVSHLLNLLSAGAVSMAPLQAADGQCAFGLPN